MLLTPRAANSGYSATFGIALDLSDTESGADDSSGGGGGRSYGGSSGGGGGSRQTGGGGGRTAPPPQDSDDDNITVYDGDADIKTGEGILVVTGKLSLGGKVTAKDVALAQKIQSLSWVG